MTDAAARLLELLALLQVPRGWPGGELSERLGVSRRTVRRDVDRLRRLGYPVQADAGRHGAYRLVAGSAMPPLLLDDDEAVAIGVGLRVIASQPIERLEEVSVRALAKLEQVLPGRLARRVRGLGRATVSGADGHAAIDPDTLVAFALGIDARERIRFGYRDRGGTVSRRLVEPHHLVCLRQRWYLVAFDLRRGDWRTFRLDRVEEPNQTATRFEPRRLSPTDPVAFVRERLYELAPTHRGVIVLHAAIADVAPSLPPGAGALTPISARRCRLEVEAETIEWLAILLLRLGRDFTVLEPPELTDRLRGLGDLIARSVCGEDPREGSRP